MEFYNLSKDYIRAKSELIGAYYKYTIGNKVEVTTVKKRNANNLLSTCLSSNKKEDKMMIRYYPNNIIYFDKDFIDNNDSNLASCFIDVDSFSVYIGKVGKYEINSGVLSFTGVLSINNLVQEQRYVYSNSQISDSDTKSKIRIFSVGVLGEELYGLYFIPKERGLAISSDVYNHLAYSVKTWNLKDFSSWSKFSLEDWFKGNKIEEI